MKNVKQSFTLPTAIVAKDDHNPVGTQSDHRETVTVTNPRPQSGPRSVNSNKSQADQQHYNAPSPTPHKTRTSQNKGNKRLNGCGIKPRRILNDVTLSAVCSSYYCNQLLVQYLAINSSRVCENSIFYFFLQFLNLKIGTLKKKCVSTVQNKVNNSVLNSIARKIGNDQMDLGIGLGLEMMDIEIIKSDHRGNHIEATMKILTVNIFQW